MAALLLPQVSRLWWGDVEVENLWHGDVLIFGASLAAPAAFGLNDWSLEMEPAGPFGANAYVRALTSDPAAVEWRVGVGAWQPTLPASGRWLLVDGTGEDIFPEGTYSDISVRWRSPQNPLFSDPSSDTKGFDFTNYVITPVMETIEVDLVPGVETTFDASIAFEQDPTSPDWPKVYWIADGAGLLPPHRWEGSVLIVDTPPDAEAGTVTVTLDAAFSGYQPPPLAGFILSGGETLYTSDGLVFVPAE